MRELPATVKVAQMEIIKVVSREILDSHGNPTVEADVHLPDGTIGRALVLRLEEELAAGAVYLGRKVFRQ